MAEQNPTIKDSLWFSEHLDELTKYAGKWAAVHNEQLIAVGDSVSEVMEKTKVKGIKELPLVLKVPYQDEGPYVL